MTMDEISMRKSQKKISKQISKNKVQRDIRRTMRSVEDETSFRFKRRLLPIQELSIRMVLESTSKEMGWSGGGKACSGILDLIEMTSRTVGHLPRISIPFGLSFCSPSLPSTS